MPPKKDTATPCHRFHAHAVIGFQGKGRTMSLLLQSSKGNDLPPKKATNDDATPKFADGKVTYLKAALIWTRPISALKNPERYSFQRH